MRRQTKLMLFSIRMIKKLTTTIAILILLGAVYCQAQSRSTIETFEFDGAGWVKKIPAPLSLSDAVVRQSFFTINNDQVLHFIELYQPCRSFPCRPLGLVLSYSAKTGEWRALNAQGMITGRESMSITQQGDYLVFFGGKEVGSTDGYSNTGAVYKISADTWSPVSTTNAPLYESMRVSWIGGERLIFRGVPPQQYPKSEGAILDLATNSWRRISQKNSPSISWVTVSAWTGDKHLEWGPRSEFGCLSSGATYDPATDRWSWLSALNAPETCSDVMAFYSNGSLLAWGGRQENKVGDHWVRDGAVYSTATDTWSKINADGAPSIDLAQNKAVGLRALFGPDKLTLWRFNRSEKSCKGDYYSLKDGGWHSFTAPISNSVSVAAEISFGIDELEGEPVLYAAGFLSDGRFHCFQFPVPPKAVAAQGREVVSTREVRLLKVANRFLYFRTVTDNLIIK